MANTNNQNSASALAVLDREISARQLAPNGHAVGCIEHPPGSAFPCSCNGPQLVATRAAIAELIEADQEYDAALEQRNDPPNNRARTLQGIEIRWARAICRRADALRAVSWEVSHG